MLSARDYHNMGIEYYERLQFDEAIQNFNRAIEIDPENAWTYCNRGNAYRKQGLLAMAIKDFTNASHLAQNYSDAYYYRGRAYYRQKNYEKAIQDLDYVIELNPDHLAAHYNRGCVYEAQKEFVKAIQDYKKVINLNSKYASAYRKLADIYKIQAEHFKQDMQHEETTVKYDQLKDKKNIVISYAVLNYTRALEIKPDYQSSLDGLSNIILHGQDGDFDKLSAEDIYSAILKLPKDEKVKAFHQCLDANTPLGQCCWQDIDPLENKILKNIMQYMRDNKILFTIDISIPRLRHATIANSSSAFFAGKESVKLQQLSQQSPLVLPSQDERKPRAQFHTFDVKITSPFGMVLEKSEKPALPPRKNALNVAK